MYDLLTSAPRSIAAAGAAERIAQIDSELSNLHDAARAIEYPGIVANVPVGTMYGRQERDRTADLSRILLAMPERNEQGLAMARSVLSDRKTDDAAHTVCRGIVESGSSYADTDEQLHCGMVFVAIADAVSSS